MLPIFSCCQRMDCEKKFTRLHSQPIQMVVRVKHERKHENENVVQILSPMVK